MSKDKSFEKTASRIPVKLLDVIIIMGIVAMAILIPYLSAKGGFTITFDSAGGTPVDSQRLRYGDPIEVPTPPTREDHIFSGWYYDKDGKLEVDFSSAKADKSTTLFAIWQKAE